MQETQCRVALLGKLLCPKCASPVTIKKAVRRSCDQNHITFTSQNGRESCRRTRTTEDHQVVKEQQQLHAI